MFCSLEKEERKRRKRREEQIDGWREVKRVKRRRTDYTLHTTHYRVQSTHHNRVHSTHNYLDVVYYSPLLIRTIKVTLSASQTQLGNFIACFYSFRVNQRDFVCLHGGRDLFFFFLQLV